MSVEVQATPTRRGPRRGRTAAVETTRQAPRRRSRAGELVSIVAVLAVLAVALPVAVADHYGALGIPRSDDWSYLLTLFRWVETGELSFNGWVSMTLVGQVLIAAPVVQVAGRSITAVQLLTPLIGLVGLLAVVFIGRQLVRPAWWAVAVAATIAAGPLWGPLAPTFMSDVPTFTFEMLMLAAAAVAFRRRPLSIPWFTVAMLLGLYSVSIRQYAAIPVIALVLVALVMQVADRDRKTLRTVLLVSAGFGIAAVGLVYWWSGLPDSKSLSPSLPTENLIAGLFIDTAGIVRLTGLLLLPILVLAGPVTIVRRAWEVSRALTLTVAGLTALWLTATYLRVHDEGFVGNYLSPEGVLSDDVLSGLRPDVIPRSVYDLLVIVGSVAGLVVLLTAVPFLADLPRRIRERDLRIEQPMIPTMALATLGFFAAYSFATVTKMPIFDRYWLPALPMIAFLMLHSMQHEPSMVKSIRARHVWAGATFVLLLLIGVGYSADSASFDATRWEVASATAERGFRPTQIAGGFEWLSWHRQKGPSSRWELGKESIGKLQFAVPCVTVVINPTNTDRPAIAQAWSSAPTRPDVLIAAYRNQYPCRESRGAPRDPDEEPIARGTSP